MLRIELNRRHLRNIFLFFGIIFILIACTEKKTAEQYFKDGYKAWKENNYYDAKRNFDAYIELDSLRLRRTVFILRGMTNIKLENYKEAVDDYSNALLINPPINNILPFYSGQRTDILNYRAYAKLKMKDFKGTIEDCNELIKKDSLNGGAFKIRSKAEKELGLEEIAKKDSLKAIELCADCPKQ
jgi:tetratricopeptide (TPR) repeat protein